MGRTDGSNGRCAALCLRRRYNTASAPMACTRNEHGQRGGVYDHGTRYEDNEFGRTQDRTWCKAVYRVYTVYDPVCVHYGNSRQFVGIGGIL